MFRKRKYWVVKREFILIVDLKFIDLGFVNMIKSSAD
jgi:hypothetical protein